MQRIPPVLLGPHLQLVSVTVPDERDDTAAYELIIQAVQELTCPHCQQPHAVRNRRTYAVRDVPYGDHPVLIALTEGSAYCRATRRHVRCVLPDRAGTVTKTLERYLIRRYGREARSHLAARTGLTEARVRSIQQQVDAAEQQVAVPQQVDVLGVDDIYMRKHRYLVAADLQTKRILQLTRVGTVIQGRASAVDLDGFFATLPQARTVALDMNPQQYEAAKKRWPSARLVIDKRHLLQTIDRDLIDLTERVVLDWWDTLGDPIGGQQAVRGFGAMAYQYLALRALVLRRRRALTPADHAAWVLLRREGSQPSGGERARLLWEAWLWREDLYDLYSIDLDQEAAVMGLRRWREQVERWQHQWQLGSSWDPLHRPLKRSLWALKTYQQATEAYATSGGVTNARTELINAALRHFLRQGRKYSSQTLVTLVNRQPPLRVRRSRNTGRVVTLKSETWVRAPSEEGTVPPHVLPEVSPAAAEGPSAERRPSEVAPAPPAPRARETRSRRPRLLRLQDPSLGLPPDLWAWLQRLEPRGRVTGERWKRRVVEKAPADLARSWRHYCAGQVQTDDGETCPAEHLARWQAVACQQYVAHHPEHLIPSERERQARLADLNLDSLHGVDADLHALAAEVYRRLATERLWAPRPEDLLVLNRVQEWADRSL